MDHARLASFQQGVFDYLEGLSDEPPSIEALPEPEKRAARSWLKSLAAARGIDPYAERPSTIELLPRLFMKSGSRG